MTQLALLDAPPIVRKMPTGTIVRDAYLSEGCRFWLKRAWGPGPCIAWVGLNPSTADGEKDDPTMLREIGFSYRWGYGSLIKLNIFPIISPSPAAMRLLLHRHDFHLHNLMVNDEICADLLTKADARMAAWGNGASVEEVGDWLDVIALERDGDGDFFDDGAPITDWKCLGTNLDGSPRHTLARGKNRVPDDFIPIPWQPRGQSDGTSPRDQSL